MIPNNTGNDNAKSYTGRKKKVTLIITALKYRQNYYKRIKKSMIMQKGQYTAPRETSLEWWLSFTNGQSHVTFN